MGSSSFPFFFSKLELCIRAACEVPRLLTGCDTYSNSKEKIKPDNVAFVNILTHSEHSQNTNYIKVEVSYNWASSAEIYHFYSSCIPDQYRLFLCKRKLQWYRYLSLSPLPGASDSCIWCTSLCLRIALVYADTVLYLFGVGGKCCGHPSQTALF